MKEYFIALLKKSHTFSILPENVLEQLSSYAKEIALQPSDILYQEGDPSEYIYILMNGKLTTLIQTSLGEDKSIDTINPGESIGELGVLSGEPRSLAVKALVYSNLMCVPGIIFRNICEKYPSILLHIIQPVLNRTQKAMKIISKKNHCKYILVVPENDPANFYEFRKLISDNSTEQDKILFISESNIHLYENEDQYISAEDKYELIVIFYTSSHFHRYEFLYERISTFYLIRNEESDIKMSNEVNNIFTRNQLLDKAKYELIIIHDKETKIASGTTKYVDKLNFSICHHVRRNERKDYQRLIRFMTGKTTGLVLGGGGIRGWGHLGVIKALEENKINIDAISGTSVGAIIGGCYALTRNFEDTYNMFAALNKMVSKTVLLKEITWPLISLFSAKHPTLGLKKIFSDLKIEDLWMPYFCISANLSTQQEEVHYIGYLWEKIRASNSLPGIVPPMVLDGQLHFDGGLVNNLPVDHMKNLLGNKSKIIASTLLCRDIDNTKYNFPPILSFTQAFLKKMGLSHKEYIVPQFFDTFLNALLLGSSLKEKQTISLADIVINMQFSTTSLLSLNKVKSHQMIEIGYNETCKSLSDMNIDRSFHQY